MFSAKISEKSVGKKKQMRLLAVLLVPVVAFILGAATPEVWAGGLPFEEAEIFFELNNTDEDLGIHGLIDGGPWKQVWIKDKRGRLMMIVKAWGRLRNQAVTELFFESAEPEFGDLDPEDFFARFPEGTYTIYGWSQDGQLLKSETEVTHLMPAPAEKINLQGSYDLTPIVIDDIDDVDCDDDGTIPAVDGGTVTISWDPVTLSHPDEDGGGAGVQPQESVTIVNYEVVVEVDVELNGDEFTSVFSVIIPPGEPGERLQVTIPAEFIAQGDEFKYEILAREESFNQTAVESCFVLK